MSEAGKGSERSHWRHRWGGMVDMEWDDRGREEAKLRLDGTRSLASSVAPGEQLTMDAYVHQTSRCRRVRQC